MSNLNDLKKGLCIIELEERLETVQLTLEAAASSRRCDRGDCDEIQSA